ncbi:MAG: hypothetical protein IJE23_02750 [Tyzzerella sp.]|nr:hypothetical protein [Tyzzerella sp.]
MKNIMFKKICSILLAICLISGLVMQYGPLVSKAEGVEQKTPEEMGFTKVSITDVGLNYQSYSGNTAGGTYSGDSLNNKYLDVDMTMAAASSAYLVYAATGLWDGYRIYVNGDGNLVVDQAYGNAGSTHSKSYTAKDLGLNAITDTFNLKFGTTFGEGFGSGDCDATYVLWINNVLIDKVTYAGAKSMGNQAHVIGGAKITFSEPVEPKPEQKSPEELGFTKVAITEVGLGYQSYSGNTSGSTYTGTSLNNKYLDVDMTMAATNSAYLVYASKGLWDGYRIYVNGSGNLSVWCAAGEKTYSVKQLELDSITERFNLKFGTTFGEGFGAGACDISYTLWINDVLIDTVSYENATGMGNQAHIIGGATITFSAPLEQKTPEELGFTRVTIDQFGHSYGPYSSDSTNTAYSGGSVNHKYLDVDLQATGSSSATLVFAASGKWTGYRIYIQNSKLTVECVYNKGYNSKKVTYSAKKLGLENITDQFNFKFGVDFPEGYGSGDTEATYTMWINDVLIDRVTHEKAAVGDTMNFLGGTKLWVSEPLIQKTPEEVGLSRVTIEDFAHSYTSYSGNTVNQPYKDGSLNNKYLDVDLTMPAKSSAMLAFATNTSQWYGYRIYVNGSGELEIDQALGNSGSTHKKSYNTDKLGLRVITDKFNLKFGVQFGEGFGTADACDATYYLWINDVLIDKVTYTGAKGMGSNLNFLDGGSNDTVIVSDPMPKVLEQKTPEEMGFSRVTIGDFKHFDGEYKHNTVWVECQKGDLNNKYLDVNITWPETASTYFTYASPNQWHGYRMYTQDGNLIIEQALSGLKQTYTPEKLGLNAITDKFNMKFGTIFGEGFGVEESCDATYVLWINDVVVDEVTYKNVKGMGNGMSTFTGDGHKGSIMLEIPVETPFTELTPSDFGLDSSSIQKKVHVATYDSNLLDATAITAKMSFSDKSGDYMLFGSEDAGIRLQMKKDGSISVDYVDSAGEETKLETLTAKKAGVSSLNDKHEWRFTFRIKGTATKNTLTMEIYINKILYNFEAITVDNVELDVLKRVWTIGSENGTFKINTVKYEELTLHDFSIFDIDVKEAYTKRNYCDYASFDGSAFTSILNFSTTAAEDRLEIGGNDWGGLSVIYTKKDQIWLVFVDPSGDGEKTVTYMKPEVLGLDTFANKDLTIRITFDLLEVAEDIYNLKLGVYVNGKLYNDQHFTVEDAAVEQLTRTLRVKVFNGPFKAKSVETKSDLSIYGFDSNWKKTLGVL